MMKHPFLFTLLLLSTGEAAAQNALVRAAHGIDYTVEMEAKAGGDSSPLWLTANRHGLSSVSGDAGYLRAGIERPAAHDSLHKWRIGYGIDLAGAYNFTSSVVVQQAYVDVAYKLVRLSVGAKERPMQLKNQRLSSGSQTLGINARPVPEVRFELPEYWSITGKSNWAAIKGHVGYGCLTDGGFQQDYAASAGNPYAKKVLYHSKAGYLRLGNAEKFPLTFEGGLEMACLFGGTSYQNTTWGNYADAIKHPSDLGAFVDALFGVGGDSTDGDGYANASGNSLGSWLFSLKYHGRNWSARAYYDHFFEDHSMMFFEYGWRDGLWGLEVELPKNPAASTLVYEFMNTTYQSGPVYHDHTSAVPDQISGIDDYYNHALYAGWQHWGQAIGNPLFTSPLYSKDGSLRFRNNRFKAHHFGLSGQPVARLDYRLLFTWQKSWGTYASPYADVKYNRSFLAEAQWHFPKGWRLSGSFGYDHGDIAGNNTGFALTLKKCGRLVK